MTPSVASILRPETWKRNATNVGGFSLMAVMRMSLRSLM